MSRDKNIQTFGWGTHTLLCYKFYGTCRLSYRFTTHLEFLVILFILFCLYKICILFLKNAWAGPLLFLYAHKFNSFGRKSFSNKRPSLAGLDRKECCIGLCSCWGSDEWSRLLYVCPTSTYYAYNQDFMCLNLHDIYSAASMCSRSQQLTCILQLITRSCASIWCWIMLMHNVTRLLSCGLCGL